MIEGLRVSDDEEILLITIDTVRREADVWTAMDRWPSLVDALSERNAVLRRKGHHHKGLVNLLLELAADGYLMEDDEEELRANANAQVCCVRVGGNMLSLKEASTIGNNVGGRAR